MHACSVLSFITRQPRLVYLTCHRSHWNIGIISKWLIGAKTWVSFFSSTLRIRFVRRLFIIFVIATDQYCLAVASWNTSCPFTLDYIFFGIKVRSQVKIVNHTISLIALFLNTLPPSSLSDLRFYLWFRYLGWRFWRQLLIRNFFSNLPHQKCVAHHSFIIILALQQSNRSFVLFGGEICYWWFFLFGCFNVDFLPWRLQILFRFLLIVPSPVKCYVCLTILVLKFI